MINARRPRGPHPRPLIGRRDRPVTFPPASLLPAGRQLPSTGSFLFGRTNMAADRKQRAAATSRGSRRPSTPRIVIELADTSEAAVTPAADGRLTTVTGVAPSSARSATVQGAQQSARAGAGSRTQDALEGSGSTGETRIKQDITQACQQRAPIWTLSPPVGPSRRRSTSSVGREALIQREALGSSPDPARRCSQPLLPSGWPTATNSSERRLSQSGPPPAPVPRMRKRGLPPCSTLDIARGQLPETQRRHSDGTAGRPFTSTPLHMLRRLSSEPGAAATNRRNRDICRPESEPQPRKRDAEVVVSDLKNGTVSAPTMRLLGLVQRVPTSARVKCLLRRLDSPPVDVLSERSRRVTIQFHSEYRGTPEPARARSLSMPAMDCAERGDGGGIVCKTNDILRLQQSFERSGSSDDETPAACAASEPGGGLDKQKSPSSSADDSVVPWEGNGLLVNVWAIGKALEDYLNFSDHFSSH